MHEESRRVAKVLDGTLTAKQAALLSLSERHVKRLKKGMKEEGIPYLAHKNRGRTTSEENRKIIIALGAELDGITSYQQIAELLVEKGMELEL